MHLNRQLADRQLPRSEGAAATDKNTARDHSITVTAELIERILSLEIARVAESAAVSAALLRGLANEIDAARAAVNAMRI